LERTFEKSRDEKPPPKTSFITSRAK